MTSTTITGLGLVAMGFIASFFGVEHGGTVVGAGLVILVLEHVL